MDTLPSKTDRRKLCRWLKAFLGLLSLCVVTSALVVELWAPAGRWVEKSLNSHLAAMHCRQLNHQSTAFDRLQCHLLYGSLATIGRLVAPEAGAIVSHYLYGDGSTLNLSNEYIRRSPVVRRHLVYLRPGDSTLVKFRQQDDWRLSYALNGFSLKREKNRVVVRQWMAFDTQPQIHTILNLGRLRLTVPDGLIHVLRPRPYMVYCVWFE